MIIELMTTNEVADLLHRSEETIRYWRARGTGPRSFKAGRGVLYKREDVESWIAEQYERAAGGAV